MAAAELCNTFKSLIQSPSAPDDKDPSPEAMQRRMTRGERWDADKSHPQKRQARKGR